ncbi:hypothetical protein MBLNU230_g6210t1 [Neophaeotheca triangularis]
MCGISCILSQDHPSHTGSRPAANGTVPNGFHSKHEATRNAISRELDASLDQIRHRGPDSRGQWISDDNRVALGHVRLSINDLSPEGAQPFHSPNGKIHAVVNGEFYDYDRIRAELEKPQDGSPGYHFASHSDSELSIALYLRYGQDFVQHLRGEFACIIYDEPRQLFLAARDRYGIKPLFWTQQNGRLLLSAEMKGFLPLGWQPEWDVRSLKDAGWNCDQRTVFKGVRKIRPGHLLVCQSFGGVTEQPYWDMEFPDKRVVNPITPEEAIEGVRERMLHAIRLRLRADVPVGIYLSGGIDSSVIAGMVEHLVRTEKLSMGSVDADSKIAAFSIAFNEDSGFDESSIANRTADWLGVKYYKKHMSEAELARRFEDAVWHCEHHNPDLNFVGKYALSEVPAEHGYKVVLTGEGADEHFGGYPTYLSDFLRESDDSWPAHNPLPEPLRQAHFDKAEAQAKAYYESVGADSSTRGPSLARRTLNNISTVSSMAAFQPDLFSPWTAPTYGATDPQETIATSHPGLIRQKIQHSWHPLHSAQYVWAKAHLPNIFLTCLGDRTEMAHSIEARTPLLDHELTQYVNALPPASKIHYDPATDDFVEKWLLREAAKPFITRELYSRKKHPYSAPTAYPVDGPLMRVLGGLVTKEAVEQLGFVEWRKCEGLVGRAFGADADPGALRLLLLVAEWVVLSKRFGVKRAGPEVVVGEV